MDLKALGLTLCLLVACLVMPFVLVPVGILLGMPPAFACLLALVGYIGAFLPLG